MVTVTDPADCLRAAVATLRRKPAGLLTDVDGTISCIAPRPEEATVHPQTIDVLRRLSRALDVVAVVSGRSVSGLRSMIQVEGLTYVGNHGLEWWRNGHATVVPAARPFLPQVVATMQCLRDELDLPGLLLEEKGATASIHYRLSPNPRETRETILRFLAGCLPAQGLRVSEARKVIDLLPPVSAGKGTAVRQLVRSRHLRGALYLGDDSTDLDAFRALRSLRSAGSCDSLLVAVAGPEAPDDLLREADYQLDGVDSILAFLEMAATWLEQTPRG